MSADDPLRAAMLAALGVRPTCARPPAPIIIVATPTSGAGGATRELMVRRAGRIAAPPIDTGDEPGAIVAEVD
ncbi:MAG TPA: hypothetical protein VFN76_04265 [Candidatus Limnocylindria bacterium]|nr:hypothetical protein [Candidatus Limnocylindria bacterium]